MSAITAAIPVDETLVKLQTTLSTHRLTEILRQLSRNAATNARVIVSLQNSVEDVKASLTQELESMKSKLAHEVRQRVELEDRLNEQQKAVEALQKTVALRDYVDSAIGKLGQQLQKATVFIEEIESGKGARVTAFVSKYIQDYIPKWYAGVSADMMDNVNAIVQSASHAAAQALEKRAAECEQKSLASDAQLQTAVLNNLYSLNDERKKEISKVRQELVDRCVECDNKTELLIDKQKYIAGKRHAATRRRLTALEESAAALRTTLCLEDSVCRELHNLVVRQAVSDEYEARTYLVPGLAANTTDDKEIDSGIPGEQRKPDPPEMFTTMSADQSIRDIRVRRVAQSAHFVGLRAACQKEFGERMDFLKTDLHNDLVNEIFDIQKELRTKVGTSKLGELLDHHRDENLYSNVKLLMQDMSDVKINKVDTVLFVEGLRSKADLRALELKVDKSIYNQQIETVEHKLEDLTNASHRQDARIARAETSITTSARRGTIAGSPHAGRRATQVVTNEGTPFAQIEDKPKSAGKLFRGRRRSSVSPQRPTSPGHSFGVTAFMSGRDSIASPFDSADMFPVSLRRSEGGNSPKNTAPSVANLVDQIVERGFPSQVVVQESRDLSSLHQKVVKTSHEKQVEDIISVSTSALKSASTADPDLELPALPGAVSNSQHAARISSSRPATRGQTSSASPRIARQVSAPLQTQQSTSPAPVKPTLIPLTASQDAYCAAVDGQPPPNAGKGFAFGLKIGERRDY